ncbi:uncharacterized protein [Henckelia pumila]|uniref:uncharacterized protein n=1 Tax=Henckelia pumila TaxID=405737 RepID=UPI003C6E0079
MAYDRSWMDRRYVNGSLNDEYINEIEVFVAFAKSNPTCLPDGTIRCPCNHKKCQNLSYWDENTVKFHLCRYGFVPNYYNWYFHGENYIRPSFEGVNMDAPSSSRSSRRTSTDDMPPNFANLRNPNSYFESEYQYEGEQSYYDYPNVTNEATVNEDPNANVIEDPHINVTEEDPNMIARALYDMIKSTEKEIWEGNPHGHNLLSVLARLLKMKYEHSMSERNYNDMCQLMTELCPADHNFPKNFNATKRLVKDMGLPVEKIDFCNNNCMIYWGIDSELTTCRFCEHPRYKQSRSRGFRKNMKQIAYKHMYYFPLTPRLQRLYASEATASHMRWHHEHVYDGETMTHPSDSPAWRNFTDTHPTFASEIRNVRLALSADGFQPFGQSGQQYSSWPVILTPYNLPPWMCMKDEYMFLTVLAPGPKNPKDKLDVFLQPLVTELQSLWHDGAITYDIHSRTNFTLRAALMWTISDFPAYAMLSGWSTAGKQACPHCMSDSEAFTLTHSRKTSWFDNHRKFLPVNHPLRRSRNLFRRGQTVSHTARPMRSGHELLDELDSYGFLPSYEVDAEEHNKELYKMSASGWRKRSIFWELPYWSSNMVRHTLDVMHIEKNVFDNIVNTLMNVPGKTKDNAKSRADLVEMSIRPELHFDIGSGRYPKTIYSLEKEERRAICRWLKDVRFSDGYVSKLSRCVDMNKLRVFGLKSHDCHVFMQRLIPVVFKELLPKEVWEVLTELSLFFSDLTARNIKVSDVLRLNEQIPVIMCKLEKIFPPSFFDSMEHLCIHLPYKALVCGPVQDRWMYPFERYLSTLKKTVRNKARVEGSICNAYLVKEASIFCQHYFSESIKTREMMTMRNRTSVVNEGVTDTISVFKVVGRSIGASKSRNLQDNEYHSLATYMLLNCAETRSFVQMYENHLRLSVPGISNTDVDAQLQQNFFPWFKNYTFENQDCNISPDVKQLAIGPLSKVKCLRGYAINGFNFHTKEDSTHKATDNSGVHVKGFAGDGTSTDYYGIIDEILEVKYSRDSPNKTILFRCTWFDTHPRLGTRVHPKYKIVEINRKRRLRYYDPFVFCTQASQVVYLTYPSTKKTVSDWVYVSGMRKRDYVPQIRGDMDHGGGIANEAFQNHESQSHGLETQLLLNTQSLVDVTVMYDNDIDTGTQNSDTDNVQASTDEETINQSEDSE